MPATQFEGKGGTLAPEDFDTLGEMVEAHTSKLVVQKVAKILTKKADLYAHEYPGSMVAAAYKNTAGKIISVIGAEPRGSVISRDFFTQLSSMVERYGAEVVTLKVAKLAKRSGDTASSNSLKGIFPKTGS